MSSVTNGGSVSGTTTSSGDVVSFSRGGTGNAVITVVAPGGILTSAVLKPGDGVTVQSGGASYFTSGVKPMESGSIAYPTPAQESQEYVYGLSTSATMSAYADASTAGFVDQGKPLNIIEWGASQYVHAGGEAYGATFTGVNTVKQLVWYPEHFYGDWSQVVSGDVPVTASATQYVESGGLARSTTLNDEAFQIVSEGGVARDTTVNSGGLQTVQMGGSAVDTTINAYGSSFVTSGGSAINVDVGSGGVLSAGSGATLTDITLENGGRLDVSKDTLFTDRIAFNGGTIDITDLTGSGTPDYTFSGDNRLTITRDGVSETILFDGVYDPTKLLVTTDTDGSTLIDYGTPAPCYCPGTLIATAEGETPVEALEIGDLVRTASGALRPIRWIGRRAYDGVFARGNPDLIPVTFEKGSLGHNLPKRALTVSPLHAMFVEGYLIPAHCLVNGGSIHYGSIGERVEYIHVELESHDLLLVEGAPSESFVDDGSRGMFHNAGTFAELYPEAETVEAVYCAPRLEDGTMLEHIRDRLSAHTGSSVRLGLLASDRERQLTGWAVDLLTPSEPVALEVLLNGRVIGMTLADGPSGVVSNGAAAYGFTFGLPRGVTTASGAFSLRAVSSMKAAA
ncbi:Hint domain-containing protein [Acetobacter sicerae]|uniref:Hint domain-containing protein n=1 Tax=Acetobacter sicerae TaxID=85325 RepID=A0ABS8VXA5_9PROT|nr:Hint domain-containing protein [Acetobacter sicerae]MCE0744466.1 Hint domain-containing protein [Acetobacter sicerae]